MSFKLHLILALVFMQIRCNFSNISYLSETQKNNFQFLNETYSPNSDILTCASCICYSSFCLRGCNVFISASPRVQWYCRFVMKNSVLGSWVCSWAHWYGKQRVLGPISSQGSHRLEKYLNLEDFLKNSLLHLIWVFTVCKATCLGVSWIQRITTK